ncbi:O-methyltransferase [Saccharopolyspora sp. ASAGF58]|uniref:O-methyltransferase n=1 Tax=Saccharopolyspora sp. ASAGF58 TaxID=2719023 RepID=UPI00143FCA3A|nr:class I SAM-dependent methyltransferase [Saccharopolyspora sp. ASAGF58]QIZ36862.1 methyltransferase domain-containing protein [Saccharopolyspora sp. ASAGF58]
MTTPKSLQVTSELYQYILDHSAPADPVLDDLATDTLSVVPDTAHMMVPRDEAAFLTFLVRLTGARTVVEVGTFTGSSTIALARGLPEQGRLITCDISTECVDLARQYFRRAGLSERIEARVGPALETLRTLPTEPHIDLVFIDADKPSYIDYWNELVPRVRPGGLLIVDNTLFSGAVIEPTSGTKAHAIDAFNRYAAADSRVEIVMLHLADGISLARRL